MDQAVGGGASVPGIHGEVATADGGRCTPAARQLEETRAVTPIPALPGGSCECLGVGELVQMGLPEACSLVEVGAEPRHLAAQVALDAKEAEATLECRFCRLAGSPGRLELLAECSDARESGVVPAHGQPTSGGASLEAGIDAISARFPPGAPHGIAKPLQDLRGPQVADRTQRACGIVEEQREPPVSRLS